jgi:Leucine-rich repeat (LRR) protein
LLEQSSIDLRNKNIGSIENGTFEEFRNKTNLKQLFIGNNKLTTLANGSFNGLNKLEELYLDSNTLTTIAPGSFDDLASLKLLDLNSNSLRRVEGWFQNLYNLEALVINSNNINTIMPNAFSGLTNLRSLNLYGNPLVQLNDSNILQGLFTLNTIQLQYCSLTDIDTNVFTNVNLVGKNSAIYIKGNRSIYIKGNPIASNTFFVNAVKLGCQCSINTVDDPFDAYTTIATTNNNLSLPSATAFTTR